jgi:hypothetical protein
MGLDATTRRRWIGALCLASALVMLVCGQTFLEDRLSKNMFLLYWLLCFVFLGLAMIVAVRDLRCVSLQARQEQRKLLADTLKEIETEARARTRGGNPNDE